MSQLLYMFSIVMICAVPAACVAVAFVQWLESEIAIRQQRSERRGLGMRANPQELDGSSNGSVR